MMRRLLQAASSVALFGLGVAACGGEPNGAEGPGDEPGLEQPIIGGELDTRHTNVFGMVIHQEGETATSCTATLLAPNLLLTARHCLSKGLEREVVCGQDRFGDTYLPEHLQVTNAPQFRASVSWFTGKQIHVPEEGDDTCGFDIALVVLATNVPSVIATPAVPRIDQQVGEGEAYVAVGYGVSDDGRAGSRMVRSGLSIECEPGRCGIGVRGSEFVGDTGICEGDSGGPAFDESGKVVGVVSRGGEDCSTPIYGTVTAWRSFIVDVAAAAAEAGGYEVPFWVTSGSSDPPPIPEPPPPPKGSVGAPCLLPSECETGSTCQGASLTGRGTCAAVCSTREDCPSDFSCEPHADGSTKVCLESSRAETRVHELKSSCGFGAAPVSQSAPLAALWASMLLALRRRRRVPAGPSSGKP